MSLYEVAGKDPETNYGNQICNDPAIYKAMALFDQVKYKYFQGFLLLNIFEQPTAVLVQPFFFMNTSLNKCVFMLLNLVAN